MKDTRKLWEDSRNILAEKAEAMKDSQSVSFDLIEIYDGLTNDEREEVHDILAEWLVSEDNALRYDAGFLISQRKIKSLRGAVEKAVIAAQDRTDPGANFEIRKLRRILNDLSD